MPALHLAKLRLSHFRSYEQGDLPLAHGITALFGPNGAGKTNLLEAVSLLSPGRGMRRAKAPDLARRPEPIGWRLRADLTSPDGEHEVMTGAEAGATGRTVEIDGKAAAQTHLSRIARVIWLTPQMDRLWLEAAADRRAYLDRVTMSLIPAHAEAALAYEKSMRERNRLLKEGGDVAWIRSIEAQMAAKGAEVIQNRAHCLAALDAAQSEAETAFPAAELSIDAGDAPQAESEADLALLFADMRPRDMAAGRTLGGPHRADLKALYAEKGMEARNCSTGEQKALLVSLILANARAVAADFGAPPILLLDEIAAHFDEDRRRALYDEIEALGAQAVLSGTGPELFDALDGRAEMIAIREDGQRSVIVRE